MNRIFKLNAEAVEKGMDWDEAISNDMLETVDEFDSYEEAVTEYEENYNDPDVYGVE